MKVKLLVSGFLAACGLLLFATGASAATCLTTKFGTCTYTTKGVLGNLVTDSTNGPSHTYQFFTTFTILPPTTGPVGVIACANSGSGNTSPGIQTVVITDPNAVGIWPTFNPTATASPIKGTGYQAKVIAGDPSDPDDVAAFQPLNIYCPNANWTVVDEAPCNFQADVDFFKDGSLVDGARSTCSLSSCSSLKFNQATRRFNTVPYDNCSTVPK